ncbi:uncharacterized protein LOC106012129 [Aplysia californica]|uniref:Uncharacterized protein LOC106012129 n=1 Tax=Aplysia californica TaxID=6500 RepID=A0ABM1A2H3_APLCA|nr:uncharacterized protein LOC106012129 [Aplysia californica]
MYVHFTDRPMSILAVLLLVCILRSPSVFATAEAGRRSPGSLMVDVSHDHHDDEEGLPPYDVDEVEKHECTYFYSDRFPEEEGGLVNCSWYTSKSCCKKSEATAVFSAMDPLYSASLLCRNYINYLMCFFCSPDQYKFYKSNQKVMVCPDYCDAMYEECKTAGFQKTLIGEEYSNGTAFCEAQNFDVVDSADCFEFDPNVFGSSVTPGPVLGLVFVAVAVLVLS